MIKEQSIFRRIDCSILRQVTCRVIEWNLEETLLCLERKSVNVGEVYVKPSLRGSGLVKALLNTAENRAMNAGFEYMWVGHGDG